MRLRDLVRLSQRIALKHPEVEDIILFGSRMKGKEDAHDLDILLLFKNNVDKKIEAKLRKGITNADISSLTKKEFFARGFIAKEGIYLEGYSLVSNRKISDSMGFSSIALIRYDLANIKGSKRVRFYYALHGRGTPGFLKEIAAARFSENMLVCDYSAVEKVKPFFETWQIEYSIIPALIPSRLRHIVLGTPG